MPDAKNKTALVTGGSRGLGRNIAVSLAEKGIDVILTYNSNKDKAEEVVSEIKSMGRKAAAFQLNTGDVKSFDAFLEQVTSYLKEATGSADFDFLINNAGTGLYQPFVETTEEQFDELCNVNFKGVFFLCQKSLCYINDGGRIINITSGLTRYTLPGPSAYAATKGAVEVMSRFLAKELGGRRISVNALAPGAIATDFNGGRIRDDENVNKNISDATAFGRPGEPEDIGPVVAFLCTSDAQWINAQRIEVSGGLFL